LKIGVVTNYGIFYFYGRMRPMQSVKVKKREAGAGRSEHTCLALALPAAVRGTTVERGKLTRPASICVGGGTVQGCPRPFKAIQAHSTPFKGFREKIFFYGPDGSHGQATTGEGSKASQTVPRLFPGKKRLFIFCHGEGGLSLALCALGDSVANTNQIPAHTGQKNEIIP
jgi:hypothetical protein